MNKLCEKTLAWLALVLALLFFFVEKTLFSTTDVVSDFFFSLQMVAVTEEGIDDAWRPRFDSSNDTNSTSWKWNAATLINGYGYAMWFPMAFSVISCLPHVYMKKAPLWTKILELLLILFQFYPQYLSLKLMYEVARNNNPWKNQDGKFSKDDWHKKKDTFEKEIGCNEAILESLLQFNIVIVGGRAFLEGTVGEDGYYYRSENPLFGDMLHMTNYQALNFTIVLSTLTGCWGLSKFWKLYILRGNAVVSWGFILIFSICSLFCFRAAISLNLCVLASCYTGFTAFSNVPGETMVAFFIMISFLMMFPPIVWSWIHLHKNFTIKEHWEFLLNYPPYFIAPAFSPFILESVIVDTEIKKQVRVSIFATIVNSVWLYVVPNFILYVWIRGDHQSTCMKANFRNVTSWPDESMNSVVFGYDPAYEILLASAIGSMLVLGLLVAKRTCFGPPILTDLFTQESEHQSETLPMSDVKTRKSTQVVECPENSGMELSTIQSNCGHPGQDNVVCRTEETNVINEPVRNSVGDTNKDESPQTKYSI